MENFESLLSTQSGHKKINVLTYNSNVKYRAKQTGLIEMRRFLFRNMLLLFIKILTNISRGERMKSVFIGECMVELSTLDGGLLQKSFAGDIFNSAVYMKRLMQEKCDVSVLTAIGEDQVSTEMEAFFKRQGLGTDTVCKSSDGTVGLYMISTDDTGERSFSYWRENSVARRLMYILNDSKVKIVDYNADMIFFTGISLAILDLNSRECLLEQISEARRKGARIAFDPNYRKQLWENKETAAKWINLAYEVSDIIFPSFEEEEVLFNMTSIKSCLERLKIIGAKEIVLKAGEKGMYVQDADQLVHREFISA
ncbi:MAG: sugar kinase, partial [Betaproteobacteria bacterium]|nr:sugar kinase [Betaproteobacteria bacterium]